MQPFPIELWRPEDNSASHLQPDLTMLAEVLHATVHAGGSVSFVLPFSMDDACSFWRDCILPDVRAGKRRVLAARDESKIVGTVQLNLNTPPNQPHRAEVQKLLVHPGWRRKGIARALMAGIEEVAGAEGRTLLTLDTVRAGAAEPLYRSMGYVPAGVIPRYALNASRSELEDTTVFYKELALNPLSA